MYKRILCLMILILLIAATTGCFGSPAPDFRNQTARYDNAVKDYGNAKTLYNKGSYTEAKAAFIQVIREFQDNKTALTTLAHQNITTKEKYLTEQLIYNADQYSYAASFMRDAADAYARGNKNQAYAIELNAEEFDQAARLKYEDISKETREYLNALDNT